MTTCKYCGQISKLGAGQCYCQQYFVRDNYSNEQKTIYANGYEAAARKYMEDKYKWFTDKSDIGTTLTVSKGQFVKTFNIDSFVTFDWRIEEEKR